MLSSGGYGLAGARAAIEERFGPDDGTADPRTVMVVHEHGELGPVLTVRGHGFTGPADLD